MDAAKDAAVAEPEPAASEEPTEASADDASDVGESVEAAPARPERKREAEVAKPVEAAEGDDADGEKFLGTGAKAARAGMAMANKIVPALKVAGGKTRTAMLGLLATVQKKRAERAEQKKANAPKRTTAPAPNGALKAEGRRLVRDDGTDEEEAPPQEAKPKMNRKAAVIGGAVGLVAVLAVFGASRGHRAPPEPVAAVATAEAVAATTARASLPMPAEPPPGGALTAQVPLFGATPMSTTEAVPTAPAQVAGAAPAPGMPTQPEQVAQAGDVDDNGGPDDGDPGAPAKATGVKEWGHGSVKKPVVLKLKMDGPVDGLNGASGAMGFTISLPGRRALSSASELARKDKRIASINVVNSAHGADVSLQFKDGVPPYMAKAKGDVLEIDLGSDHEHGKKVAAKGGKHGDSKKKKSKKK
jgi:hypothetical protein